MISLCLEGLQALGAGTNERERKWGSGREGGLESTNVEHRERGKKEEPLDLKRVGGQPEI